LQANVIFGRTSVAATVLTLLRLLPVNVQA
jgi:hypothetical protein